MSQNLKNWIIENMSLKTMTGISPSKCRKDWFKWNNNEDKLHEIINLTSFLDDSEKVGIRLYCILNDIKEYATCGCGKIIKNPKSEFCSVKCMANSKSVIDKKKKTCNDRYGGDNPIASEEVREKSKTTLMQKYGVDSYAKTNTHIEMLQKRNKSHLKNADLWDDKDAFLSFVDGDIFNFIECMNFFNVKESVVNIKKLEYDINIPNSTKHYTLGHRDIVNYIKSLIPDINIQINTKQIISPLELDIYLSEYNLAIEFDGVYWHSDKHAHKNDLLHKTELCEEQGINLLHIYDLEWANNNHAWKSIIKSKLKLNTKIYARKCTIKNIDNNTKNIFLDENHLQGKDISSIRFGLFHQDKLVSIMTFCKSRYNKNYDYELSRFATLSGYTVVGGAGKLLKHFERNYTGTLISYANRRHSNGNLYQTLGFEKIKNSPPAYSYFKNGQLYNRIQFQKHKLQNKLDNFDESLTAKDNMLKHGYTRIYDCGNFVFVLKKS